MHATTSDRQVRHIGNIRKHVTIFDIYAIFGTDVYCRLVRNGRICSVVIFWASDTAKKVFIAAIRAHTADVPLVIKT